jgi:hypothetical protein
MPLLSALLLRPGHACHPQPHADQVRERVITANKRSFHRQDDRDHYRRPGSAAATTCTGAGLAGRVGNTAAVRPAMVPNAATRPVPSRKVATGSLRPA